MGEILLTKYSLKEGNLTVRCLCCGGIVRFSRVAKRDEEFLYSEIEKRQKLEKLFRDCEDIDRLCSVTDVYKVRCPRCGSDVLTRIVPNKAFFEPENDDLNRLEFFKNIFSDRARTIWVTDIPHLVGLRPMYEDEHVSKRLTCSECETMYVLSSDEEFQEGRIRYTYCPACGTLQTTNGSYLIKGRIPKFINHVSHHMVLKNKVDEPTMDIDSDGETIEKINGHSVYHTTI